MAKLIIINQSLSKVGQMVKCLFIVNWIQHIA